jgi:hypothetical protein
MRHQRPAGCIPPRLAGASGKASGCQPTPSHTYKYHKSPAIKFRLSYRARTKSIIYLKDIWRRNARRVTWKRRRWFYARGAQSRRARVSEECPWPGMLHTAAHVTGAGVTHPCTYVAPAPQRFTCNCRDRPIKYKLFPPSFDKKVGHAAIGLATETSPFISFSQAAAAVTFMELFCFRYAVTRLSVSAPRKSGWI